MRRRNVSANSADAQQIREGWRFLKLRRPRSLRNRSAGACATVTGLRYPAGLQPRTPRELTTAFFPGSIVTSTSYVISVVEAGRSFAPLAL